MNHPPGYGPPTPVPIHQWEDEFTVLLDAYRELAPRRALEIGTFHGGTLYHWLQNAEPGTTVVSVDSYQVGVDNRPLYDGWCPDGVAVVAVEGDSRDPATVAEAAKLGPYQFVFIDAGHGYDEVAADWANYGGLCERGIVAFHDIRPVPGHGYGVDELWAEIKADGYLTEEILLGPQGGGIGIVRLP